MVDRVDRVEMVDRIDRVEGVDRVASNKWPIASSL